MGDGFLDQLPGESAQWAALRRLRCPALLIRGQHSDVLGAGTAARMARELAAVRVAEIRDAAHDLTVEQPAGLAAAIERFTDAG